MMTHRMQHGLPAWPAWQNYRAIMKHGLITLAGMIEYHLPATLCGALGTMWEIAWLQWLAGLLWIMATVAVPGYMSHTIVTLWIRARCLTRSAHCGGWPRAVVAIGTRG